MAKAWPSVSASDRQELVALVGWVGKVKHEERDCLRLGKEYQGKPVRAMFLSLGEYIAYFWRKCPSEQYMFVSGIPGCKTMGHWTIRTTLASKFWVLGTLARHPIFASSNLIWWLLEIKRRRKIIKHVQRVSCYKSSIGLKLGVNPSTRDSSPTSQRPIKE